MKKIIYLLMLIVSTLALNSAYAVENFTNSQDLGAGQVQLIKMAVSQFLIHKIKKNKKWVMLLNLFLIMGWMF